MADSKQGRFLSWMLLGLPIGLLVSVTVLLVVVWAKQDGRSENAAKAGRVAGSREPAGEVEAKLREYVSVLSEQLGERSVARPGAVRAAELFIESTAGPNNIGYGVRRREFDVEGRVYANLEAVLPGLQLAEEVVVVGAHYDTAEGSPGADDNASGIAALLVLAERFAHTRQQRTIRWVAFCNEEPPWFQTPDMGSARYAAELKREGVKVVAMLALESLGYFSDEPGSQKYPEPLAKLYPDVGNFLGVVGNLENRKLVDFACERLRETGLLPVEKGAFPEMLPGVGWSDHWAFWQEGFPAVMLTDTAPYRNPHYHRATDRADTIDFGRFGKAVDAIEALVAALANERREAW